MPGSVCVYPAAQIVWFRGQHGQITVGGRCFPASAFTAIMHNWILKNWLFSPDKRWICAFIASHLDDSKRLPHRVAPGQSHYPFQKLLHYFFFFPFPAKLSPVSPIFSSRGSRQVTLLYFIACCLFWQGVWHERCGSAALTNPHSPFAPLCSASTCCLAPACLVRLQPRGTWQTELLWPQSNRKSMRKDFPYSGGVRQAIQVCFKPFLW